MFSLIAILVANALVVVLLFYNFHHKRKHLPPGPTPLPLIGNVATFFWSASLEKCFLAWRRVHGDVFTYWLGELPVVVMASHEKILSTFQRDADAFAGRKRFDEFEKITRGGNFGVIGTDGALWREHRRFALHLFRDLGVGKNVMEQQILDEFTAMELKIDAALLDAPWTLELNIVQRFIDPAVGSVINSILFGHRFDDERLDEFFELKAHFAWLFKGSTAAALVPILACTKLFAKAPYFRGVLDKYKRTLNAFKAFFQRQIDEHRARDADDSAAAAAPPTDYVDAFLKQQAKLDELGEEHTFTDAQLLAMCLDLWTAGQATSTITVSWAIVYLLHHPDVVRRAHAELDAAIGDDERRLVTIADRAQLPYMNALINEVQRCANLTPQLVHTLMKEVVVDGHRLPKGTCVVALTGAMVVDDEVFHEPERFSPERFLDADGKFERHDALLPFGVGKRQCLGEPLARYELFLFIANLLQRFRILPGEKMPSLARSRFGFPECQPFTCIVQKRS